jgi:two-component system, OmpR family, alkaline phosphatase synthesis response regulator PhoP
MNVKIAVVEDDQLILNMVRINLERQYYQVSGFTTGEALLEQIPNELFDLFILDIMLPGISGIDILANIRQKEIHAPVLMLTAQGQVQNKVNALNTGADDYLVKPFNMEELLARVNALLRRSHSERPIPSDQIISINQFKINLATRHCESNQGEAVLSEKEARLLTYFIEHAGQTLKRADILEDVWGMDVSPTLRTVDNFVLKFRKLFENNPEKPDHFISIRSKGYRFKR